MACRAIISDFLGSGSPPALGVRGEEGANAFGRRWDGDGVRWEETSVWGGGRQVGGWGVEFLLTVEDVAVCGLWSCGDVGMEASVR